MLRDKHCRFPGCDRPVAWADGHHLRHWIDGGPTAMWNVWLLCAGHITGSSTRAAGADL